MNQTLNNQLCRLSTYKRKLGVYQMRIMVHMIYQLQHFISIKIDYLKKTNDFWIKIAVFDLVKSANVKQLREALDSLMKKVVRVMHYLPDEAAYLEIVTTIIKEYKYSHGEDYIYIQVSEALLPQIIDLGRGYVNTFFAVDLENYSCNALKLYQYLFFFRYKKKIQCGIEVIRKWLQVGEKHKTPSKIKKSILEPAMIELKEKADVWFDIEHDLTKGRKILGWQFNIYMKKEVQDSVEREAFFNCLINYFCLSEMQANAVIALFQKSENNKNRVIKVLWEIQLKNINNKIKKSIGRLTVIELKKTFGKYI